MAFRRHRGRQPQPQPLLNMAAVELGAQDGEWVPCSDDAARVAPPPNNLLLVRDDAILHEARLSAIPSDPSIPGPELATQRNSHRSATTAGPRIFNAP